MACRAAICATYRINNREAIRARSAAYRDANRESVRAIRADYYADNKAHECASNAAYRAANREAYRTYRANYRARVRNAEGIHTAADIKQLFTLQKGKCVCCRVSIKDGFHVDHIYPLADGGGNDKLNLQLLCQTCNLSKHVKHPVDFMQQQGYLL